MIVQKQCLNNRCKNIEMVQHNVTQCSKCGGKLNRIFSKGGNFGLGEIRDDEFVQLDRSILSAPSPSGKDKVFL